MSTPNVVGYTNTPSSGTVTQPTQTASQLNTEFLTLLHFYKRAQFIGEEPAGAYYGYTCGHMVDMILPNSKLQLQFGILTFYMDVSGYKYADRGVMPDYPVTHTINDLLAGRDRDMELALSLARSK